MYNKKLPFWDRVGIASSTASSVWGAFVPKEKQRFRAFQWDNNGFLDPARALEGHGASSKPSIFDGDMHGFEKWVLKAIEYYADKKDMVILLSASGKSKNLINAANFCKKKKIKLITITGFDKKNKLSKLGNINIWINSKSYNLVEIAQMTILLSIVDKKIGKLVYSSKM